MTLTPLTHNARTALISATFATLVVTLPPAGALAQNVNEYPNKPVSITIPFEGNGIDQDLRFFMQQMNMGGATGTFIFEIKAGAAGSIGTNYVAKARPDGSGWNIFTYGGRKDTGIDAVEYAALAVAKGAGEILLTSMDRDGAKTGYDLGLLRAVSDAVGVPVIASGGAGTTGDLVAAVKQGGASAVLAASIFHFGEISVGEAKAAMSAAGIPMRLV